MTLAGMHWLANADSREWTSAERAYCLRALERLESVLTVGRARVLAAFDSTAQYEDDGHGSARTWLKWQTRVTGAHASRAVASMRRLRDHPAIGDALTGEWLSVSWARQIADWTDLLPREARQDADQILLAAAEGGASLDDLAALAEQIRRRTAGPDQDSDGFDDRRLRLMTTLGGAGRVDGDLTPRCATALRAVLDVLGKRAGPEDLRSKGQREHDALEEACRRLIASGCLPDRAGQPVQIQLHMSLDGLTGGSAQTALGQSVQRSACPWPAAAPGDECDAVIAPIVTGRVDHGLLERLAARLADEARSRPLREKPSRGVAEAGQSVLAETVLAETVLENAVALLSGPDGLASWLRTGTLPPPAGTMSLPLDLGAPTETIPAHLRRAVISRDRHCAWPGGCDQRPVGCQVHHVIPRSRGGETRLTNLTLLCGFHHLIAVHRWGWDLVLNPDGTMTATSPDGGQVIRGKSPPPVRAA